MRVSPWVLIALLAQAGCLTAIDAGSDLADDLPEPGETFDPACYSCHGDSTSPAPPRALGGVMDTTARGVGAHRSHLGDSSTWHRSVDCKNCHMVPDVTEAPGHIDDGDNIAELTFASVAVTGDLIPTIGADGTCSNAYCHGAGLTGGRLTEPNWMIVDGSQKECGNCHGYPPPAPHSPSTDCGSCHATMLPGTDQFLDPGSHIDGKLDVGEGGTCDSCHGSDGNSAPPRDLAGNVERTSPGVGAHRVHLGTSPWRREIACSSCHVVPIDVGAAGHIDGDNVAEVPFDLLNPVGTVDAANATCDNLYCHGNGRANNGSVSWLSTAAMTCTSCHAMDAPEDGVGLGGEHKKHVKDEGMQCTECHNGVIDLGLNIVNADLHVNGVREVEMTTAGTFDPNTRRCTNLACHENESW